MPAPLEEGDRGPAPKAAAPLFAEREKPSLPVYQPPAPGPPWPGDSPHLAEEPQAGPQEETPERLPYGPEGLAPPPQEIAPPAPTAADADQPLPFAPRRPTGAGRPLPAETTQAGRPTEEMEGGPVLSLAGRAAQALSQHLQRQLRRLGPGTPLPQRPRSFLEGTLGRRLDMLRLHTGPEAAAITGETGAAAATLGPHVMLSSTRQDLESPRGLALLAHEATHALQSLERGPTYEGAPEAREQEAQALWAEEAVGRALAFPRLRLTAPLPAGPSAPSPMPLRRREPIPPGAHAPTASQTPPKATPPAGPILMPVRAVPSVGPLQRAPADEAPAQAVAPEPAEQAPAAPDLDALAEEVYRRIRDRLRLEREWRGF